MAAQGSFRSPQDRRHRKSLEEARVLTAQLELKHLRYAVAATRYRSFRKAADALGVKQSTLSRGIAQLEARLGVILFERTSGGVRLTMAGDEILRTSMHLVETLDQMISTARNIGNGDAGHITVGFYTSLSAGNLRASLVEYAARFPKVDNLPLQLYRREPTNLRPRELCVVWIKEGMVPAGVPEDDWAF